MLEAPTFLSQLVPSSGEKRVSSLDLPRSINTMIIVRRASKAISVAIPRVLVPITFLSRRRSSQLASHPYTCDVDAEPLRRYRPGGYHPIHLGDQLKDGRYKILHKVGWGGYSTTWAARDRE